MLAVILNTAYQIKPKTYRIEICKEGVRLNGAILKWKNFKGYTRTGRWVSLIFYCRIIPVPLEGEAEIKKYLPMWKNEGGCDRSRYNRIDGCKQT